MNWEELLVDIVECFMFPLAKIWLIIFTLGILCSYL